MQLYSKIGINKITISIVFLLTVKLSMVYGQNNNSPYSQLGLGDLEKSNFDRGSSMGHCGVALQSGKYFFTSNPASLAMLDDKFFTLEMAVSNKNITYKGNSIKENSNKTSDAQWKKLMFGMKLKPYWGGAIGILPYSNSNYSFQSPKSIDGQSQTVPALYQGTGSVNNFFLTNSFKINKKLAIGINSSYYFGQLSQSESLFTGVSGLADSPLVTTRNINIGSVRFKTGIQYSFNFLKNFKATLGATYSKNGNFKGNKELTVNNGNTIIKNEKNFGVNYYYAPNDITTGFAINQADRFTYSFEYGFQDWSKSNSKGIGYEIVNADRKSIGFEYSKKQTFRNLKYEKYCLQAGGFERNTYIKVNGQQIKEAGITFGMGMNAIKSNLGVQLSFEIGRRGATESGLIQENYFQVCLITSYRDFWFVKAKQYD